ncbi:oxidoreductase [Aphelenchoides avenae]|nr:oxidoreductase [Aphelenchus avenae]
MAAGDSQRQINELIAQVRRDPSVSDTVRVLIDLLQRQLEILQREHDALKKALGPRYKRALQRGKMEEDLGPDLLTWVSTSVVVFIGLYVVRQWLKGPQFTEKVKAKGKIAVVTGANAGIGKQLVRELNLRGVKVYMLCRDVEKGRQAVKDLFSRYGCDMTRMLVRRCDLTDFSSIRDFAEEFKRGTKQRDRLVQLNGEFLEEDHVDVLINNAGIMFYPKFETTADGHEMAWQSNYLGHFLLTELLLPKLERSPDGGRVVNVSSKVHLKADSVDPEIVASKQHYSRFKMGGMTYARSKLAQVMHAVALTKRSREKDSGTKLTINACHPGVCNTTLIRMPFYTDYISKLFAPFVWFFLKTDQDGAQTPLYLALSKKVDGVSGKYFSDCSEADAHPLAADEHACNVLYNYSIEACGLDRSRY